MKDELKKLNAELENLNDQLATAESDLFIVQEYTRQYIPEQSVLKSKKCVFTSKYGVLALDFLKNYGIL